MSQEFKKPLPRITPLSKQFYKGAREHKLKVQRCKDCDKVIFYPKHLCPNCLSSNLEWVESRGKGKIYSYTVCMSGVPPWFEADLPYILAIVELEEKVRMLTRIVDCKPEGVKCDLDVEVTFQDLTDDIALPMFRPVK